MTTLEKQYTDLMNTKHEMKENGASWEALDIIEDSLFSLRKAIELGETETIESKTDSMFS